MNIKSSIRVIALTTTFLTAIISVNSMAAPAPAKTATTAKTSTSATTAQAASTTVAPATQTTTTTTAEVKPESTKKWSASFTADLETSKENLNKNIDSDATALYIFKASYKLQPKLSLFVRPSFTQKLMTMSASEQTANANDLVFGANQSLENVWNVFPKMALEHRIYLPTSQESKDKNVMTKYAGFYGMPFELNPKLEVSYNFWPSAKVTNSGASYGITHFGEIAYQISEKLALAQDLGFSHGFNSLANAGLSRNSESLILSTGLAWMASKNFTLIFQLNEQKDLLNGKYNHGIYQSDDSSYEIAATISI